MNKQTIIYNGNSSSNVDGGRNVAIIIANTQNLSSAVNDAKHLSKLYLETLTFDHVYVITDVQFNMDIGNDRLSLSECRQKTDLFNLLSILLKGLENRNIYFTLSSHGCCEMTDRNYIYYGSERVYDFEFHELVSRDLPLSSTFLAMIDACQSGTFLNLNYQTRNLSDYCVENVSESSLGSSNLKNIACISACATNQYDQDDISELGYGGGLTSSFIDYILLKVDTVPTIGGFFNYFRNRVGTIGNSPVLSFNDPEFLK